MLELSKATEGDQIDRVKLEDLLKQRFFYDMSFSIYGGMFEYCIFQQHFLYVKETYRTVLTNKSSYKCTAMITAL